MSPRKQTVDKAKGVFVVEWALFGELSRALALKVARDYEPDVVVGVATAGVIPGAVIAAILGKEFHALMVSRKFRSPYEREAPELFGDSPEEVEGRKILIVDETCDSGDTLRLAIATILDGGASEVRTAVGFKTGSYEPDYHALETESTIVLPWDREVLIDGELVPNPLYET